jgi:quinol-cytochrome oxidoreductase complex cytochrome b subunit
MRKKWPWVSLNDLFLIMYFTNQLAQMSTTVPIVPGRPENFGK